MLDLEGETPVELEEQHEPCEAATADRGWECVGASVEQRVMEICALAAGVVSQLILVSPSSSHAHRMQHPQHSFSQVHLPGAH